MTPVKRTKWQPTDDGDWLRYFGVTTADVMAEERAHPSLCVRCPQCGTQDRRMESDAWGVLCWYCWRTRHEAAHGPRVTCRRCGEQAPLATTCAIMFLAGRFCYPYCLTPARRAEQEPVQLALL